MYVFQFCDGSWRVARLTNTRFPLPVAGLARSYFEGVYSTEYAARAAMRVVERLAVEEPQLFVAR
jgi:hypothetical protein